MQGILRSGFNPSSNGRRGAGVYFWHLGPYTSRICEVWYQTRKHHYRADYDPRLAIIEGDLECAEDEYLDFEDPITKDEVVKLLAGKNLTNTQARDNGILTKIYDEYIEGIERELGYHFVIVRSCLTFPQMHNHDWYPFEAVGLPTAYVVRDLQGIRNLRKAGNGDKNGPESGSGLKKGLSEPVRYDK